MYGRLRSRRISQALHKQTPTAGVIPVFSHSERVHNNQRTTFLASSSTSLLSAYAVLAVLCELASDMRKRTRARLHEAPETEVPLRQGFSSRPSTDPRGRVSGGEARVQKGGGFAIRRRGGARTSTVALTRDAEVASSVRGCCARIVAWC